MHTKLIRIALALTLMLIGACGKKKAPAHPNAITQADAEAIAAQAPSDDFRDVEFDDNYVLLGVSGSKGAGGFELPLVVDALRIAGHQYYYRIAVRPGRIPPDTGFDRWFASRVRLCPHLCHCCSGKTSESYWL